MFRWWRESEVNLQISNKHQTTAEALATRHQRDVNPCDGTERHVTYTDLKSSFLNRDLTVNSSAVIRAHRLQLVFIQREELSSRQNTQTVDRPEETKHTPSVMMMMSTFTVLARSGGSTHTALKPLS